ncbi:MAG: extracellular solute-binding protein [Chloroflexi bacterium]|nr:extracellular solute-binding protein [Chloroflexota bacterium]
MSWHPVDLVAQRGVSRRRLFAAAADLAALGGATALTACGGQRQDNAAVGGGSPSGAPVTVQFGTRGTPEIKPLFEAAANDFMARQQRVKVELWVNEPDYYTKLPVAFAGGAAPDLAFTTSRNLLPWQHREWLADVTRGLARRKVKTNDWFDLAAQEWQVGGKQFGAPQGWGTGVLGINKTLFRNAGIALKPDFDVGWNHDEFLRLLKQVAKTGPDGNLEIWGINGWQMWTNFWNFGAEVLNKEQTKCLINTPQGIAGLQWVYDLAWSHRVMPRPAPMDPAPGGGNAWNAGLQALQENGGPHVLPAWPRQLNFEYDVALYPTGPGGRHHRFYSDGYVAWKESKQLDAATDFLAYLGTTGQEVVEKAGGRSIPAYKPVTEGIFLQNKGPFTRQRWIDALKGAKLQPLVVPFDEMTAIFNTHQKNVLAQKESPRDAAGAIEREVNALLARYTAPK